MRHLALIFLLITLILAGCSAKQKSLADLKDVAAKGETGEISYEDSNRVGINKGNLAPDLTVITTDGKEINLRALSKSRQPVILYFWASWCPYCKDDLENAEKIYPAYADKVKFVAIDMDLSENIGLITKYKKDNGHEVIDFSAGREKILRDYSVTHTTTKFAVDRNGIILWKGSGTADEKVWETLFTGLAQ